MVAWRTGPAAAAFAALIVFTGWGLYRFAQHEFDVHLRNQAAKALALAATGGTPYQWRFATADNLIAGHPFGTQDFHFSAGALQWRSSGPVEVGIVLARSVDLRGFPQLQLDLDAAVAGELRVVVREKLGEQEFISAPLAFGAGHLSANLDLRDLGWFADGASQVTVPPRNAAMLRVRFVPARAGAITLHSASLRRAADYSPLDLNAQPDIVQPGQAPARGHTAVFRLPFDPRAENVDIATIAAQFDGSTQPLILLPQRGRIEQQIELRNAVYAALPAAILIPESDFAGSFAEARALVAAGFGEPPVRSQWAPVVALALLLIVARFRSPRAPRWRALFEIALTMAAPVWLILGGHFDGTLHASHYALIALTVAYAISLSLPRVWHWNGDARAWAYAALVATAALAIGLILHGAGGHAIATPGVRQILRYFGWALLQQYLICAIYAERWNIVTGNRYAAVYLGALGFALMHSPNAALMLATFAGGLCWCAIYLRWRALLPLALSHAASALSLVMLLPPDILRSAEVSVRYFQ
ncbi:MAG TPA: CPBP family intramembrane glutamic endopeptidase [Rudaea sp.]|nr:CPBP family intramembrane glutamic endopeptidase [Rudaea sp.]